MGLFPDSLETSVSEMTNQEPPNILEVASSTTGGGFSWECSSWQSFTPLLGNYKDQSSFRSSVWGRDVGRPIGSERWTGPGCVGRAVEEKKAVIG